MMFAGIGIGVVFLGCAALLVVYGLKNRVRLDTAENERARIQREVGLGKLDGRTYTNDYFKLKITIPGNYYILDQAERDLLDRELLRDEGIVKGSIEDSVAAREQILLIAVRDIEDESKEEHPAITIGVVRFGNISSLNSPRKYLETIRESDSSYKGRETIRVGESLGSLKASTMTSTEMDSGVLETTKIYVAHVKDYLLAVAIVYTTEADGRELERLVRSIQASQ